MNHVIERICKITETFYRIRDKSIWTLVHELVTLESFTNIDRKEIEEFLKRNEYLIDFWLQRSDDKRTDSGYYFIIRNNVPEVGYYSLKNGDCEVKTFKNKIEACADFILKEVKYILEIDRIKV